MNKQVQKKALYITVSHVDLETIMTNKGFTEEQKKMCRQLLSDENNDLWRELLHGVTGSNSDIVLIAQVLSGAVALFLGVRMSAAILKAALSLCIPL